MCFLAGTGSNDDPFIGMFCINRTPNNGCNDKRSAHSSCDSNVVSDSKYCVGCNTVRCYDIISIDRIKAFYKYIEM